MKMWAVNPSLVFFVLCFIQLSEDHDRPAGSRPDRREREEEAQTAGAAGRRRWRGARNTARWRSTLTYYLSSSCLLLKRAIEAQVEERRRQRDREEASRREEEEEEERRVALEREMLERRYKLDTQREKQKVTTQHTHRG